MTDSIYLLDEFAAVTPGTPYRLFPFGRVVKGGVAHEITREYAATIKLPHFKPPIKLGSHDEATPAGGFIVGLEVRDDGLYALPEFTDKGAQAITDGDYRYHSPEIIWENSALENPTDGAPINGPLILGDALLHTPHLGEAAALYSIEPQSKQGENQMAEDTVSVPKSLWESITSLFKAAPAPAPAPVPDPDPVPAPEPVIKPEEFSAVKTERDDFKAQLDTLKAEADKKTAVAGLVSELQSKSAEGKQLFGMSYVELGKAEEAAGVLAGMSPEQRDWVMRNFKAYAAQVDEGKITAAIGSEGTESTSADPVAAFDAAVRAKSLDAKAPYDVALAAVVKENPDLYTAYKAAHKEK
jgi:hypothetical protein